MELDEGLRTSAAHKAELLARHRGEIALVKGVEVIGTRFAFTTSGASQWTCTGIWCLEGTR